MQKFVKGLLAMQFAVAGVALAQNADTQQPAQHQQTQANQNDGVLGWGNKAEAPAGTVRASTLIGTEVYNRQDKHLGEINDIVLDKDGKKIGYVVLSYGGLLGMGDKLFAMPKDMVQHTPGQDKAYVQLDEQVLRSAPGFDKNNWPSEANAGYYKQLDEYYADKHEVRAEQATARVDQQADAAKDNLEHKADAAKDNLDQHVDTAKDNVDRTAEQAGQRLDDAGDAIAEPGKEMRRESNSVGDKLIGAGEHLGDQAQAAMKDDDAHDDNVVHDDSSDRQARPAAGEMGTFQGEIQWNRRVSELLGSKVENANGDNLGEIHDLVLDWGKGEVRYAVLSHGGVLGLGDKLFAVPMNVFKTQPDDKQLLLDMPQDQLKNAPGFDRNQWPNMADPLWSKSVDDHYRQFEQAPQGLDEPRAD